VLKVTSQVATPGAESAVCDCLVFNCVSVCMAVCIFCLQRGRQKNPKQSEDSYTLSAFTDPQHVSQFRHPCYLPLTCVYAPYVRLATTLLKHEESARARDNHVLACNFTDLKKCFTDRLSNKPFLIWLLTTLPHLNYVTTLPCNLSLIACFLMLLFHKVVWQHMQGMVVLLILVYCKYTNLIIVYCKFTKESSSDIFLFVKFDRIMAMRSWPHFLLAHPLFRRMSD